jgi:hypothetical protein
MVDLTPFLPKLRPEVQEWWVNVVCSVKPSPNDSGYGMVE